MTPGGVVVRINHESLKTEWIAVDTLPAQWTEDRNQAFFFERYEGDASAASFAARLSVLLGQHVFPSVREKPMPFRPVPEPSPEDIEAPISEAEIERARASDRPLNSPARRRRGKKQEAPRRNFTGSGPDSQETCPTGAATEPASAVSDEERFWWKKGQWA